MARARRGTTHLVDRGLIKAIGHPLRTRILSVLNEKTSSPSDLAEELSATVGDVAYHVKVLKNTGFIELVKTEPRRGAVEHYYRAVHRALIPPKAWEKLPPSIQQNIATDTFQLIVDDASDALNANTYSARPDSHVSWTPMLLDPKGWDAFIALLAKTLEDAFDIQAEASARMAKARGKENVISVTMALAGFESIRAPDSGMGPSATKR